MLGILAVIGLDQLDFSNFWKGLLQDFQIRQKRCGDRIDQEKTLLPGQSDQLPGMVCSGAEGLFQDHIFPGQQGFLCLGIVEQIGGRNVDKIGVLVGQKGVHIRIDLFRTEFGGQSVAFFLGPGIHGGQADAWCSQNVSENGVDDDTGANGAETNFLHA